MQELSAEDLDLDLATKAPWVPVYVNEESKVIDFPPHELCKATENEAQMGETTYCLTCISYESVNTMCFQ